MSQVDDSAGIAPFTPAQQRLLDWLGQRQQAPAGEIMQVLGDVDKAQGAGLLAALRAADAIRPVLIEGQIYYRIVGPAPSSALGAGLHPTLRARLDQDALSFLQQQPLLHGVPEAQLTALAAKLTARQYQRNDIMLWQGDPHEQVFVIKNGLVGVLRLSPLTHETQLLAYLKQGDLLGELELLFPTRRAVTATAVALSTVDVLVLAEADYLDLLTTHNAATIALARLLAQRLHTANERIGNSGLDNRVCLIFNLGSGHAEVALGSALGLALAGATHEPTVYTAYPDASHLPGLFGFAADGASYTQPGGFDVLVPPEMSGYPFSARATLLMDQLARTYANIIIGLPSQLDELPAYLLQRADQIVLIAAPDTGTQKELAALQARLQPGTRADQTLFYTVSPTATPLPGADFAVPFDTEQPPLDEWRTAMLPAALASTAATLADRLGRSNAISVYIPTTVDVDEALDTTQYVRQTLDFLGGLFGGATASTKDAQGVWKSDAAGLVDETVHLIRTYVTQADLDRYLPQVIAYVERLKGELKQEAMALEVNEKLMLI